MNKNLEHCTAYGDMKLCAQVGYCSLATQLAHQAKAGGIHKNGAPAGPVFDIPNWNALATNIKKVGDNGDQRCPDIEDILEQHRVLTEQKSASGELLSATQSNALEMRYRDSRKPVPVIAFSASE
jgi:hypothetical protein